MIAVSFLQCLLAIGTFALFVAVGAALLIASFEIAFKRPRGWPAMLLGVACLLVLATTTFVWLGAGPLNNP